MKNTGFVDRAFTIGIFAWIDILKREKLSDSGHAALDCLEDDIEHIAENYLDIVQYKKVLKAADTLIECLDREIIDKHPYIDTNEALDKYQVAYKELKGI